MKVFLLPQDFDGPGCYRLIFPAEQMRDEGNHEFLLPHMVQPDSDKPIEYLFDHTMKDPLLDADAYVFQQRLEKWAPTLVKMVLLRGHSVIADADDFYEGAPAWNTGIRGVWANANMSVSVLKEQRRMADVLVCSTPFLAEKYGRDNKNVFVIRNALDWRMWENVTPQYEVERQRIRVGWIGAAAWRSGDLAELEKWFPDWIGRHPEVDFVAAGTSSELVHEGLRVPLAQRITLPQIDFRSRNHPLLVAQYDIGLVPLKMIPFNEAKSHLKGLEYNACGIPFVAAPTESYRWWTREGVNGFLARNPRQWVERLDELVADEGLRREMGRKARELASEQTVQKRWREWESAWMSRSRVPTVPQVARTSVSYGALQKWPEFSELLEIAKQSKVIVEIGSAAGGTMWAFTRVAPADATIVSIDLPGGIHGGHLSHLAERRRQAFVREGQDVHMVRGDSTHQETMDDLLEILGGRQIDLLFIDGDHTYEGVKSDWEMYSPLAKIVAFHDIVTHPAIVDCHVDVLWRELVGTGVYKFAEFTSDVGKGDDGEDWGGIGVIWREASLEALAA